MPSRLKIFVFFLLIILNFQLLAAICITVQYGEWNDSLTWENKFLPDFSDTILIRHKVSHNTNLDLLSDLFIIVESTGILCVRDTLKMHCDSVLNYGNVACAYFYMQGGYFYNEGVLWHVYSGKLTSVGASCKGHMHSVGEVKSEKNSACGYDYPAPEPNNPPPSIPAIDTTKTYSTDLFFSPNPVANKFEIIFSVAAEEFVSLKIFDVTGRFITELSKNIYKAGEYKYIYSNEILKFSTGIYFLFLETSEKQIAKKIVFTGN